MGQTPPGHGAGPGPRLPPVVGHEEPEVSDMGGILGEDDVAGELAGREPEGEVRRLAELELGMDPEGRGARLGAPPAELEAPPPPLPLPLLCQSWGTLGQILVWRTGPGREKPQGPRSAVRPQGLVHTPPSPEALPDQLSSEPSQPLQGL